MSRRLLIVCIAATIATSALYAQRELVPVDHPVYQFLLRQQMERHIDGFAWGMLPLSRMEVSQFLLQLESDSTIVELPAVDVGLLKEYRLEFSFDLDHSLDSSRSFISSPSFSDVFDDHQRRYLYAYADSSTGLFVDGLGSLVHRQSWGDSLGKSDVTLGDLGVRVRGTLHDKLGFFLQATNGRLLSGSHDLALVNHALLANRKFNSDEKTFYDITKGYLRYDADWVSLMAGREQLLWGMGFGDRAMFSDNTVPFDFVRIDLKSGSLHYAFVHGSLVGVDSSGRTLSSKYIAAHRLEFSVSRRVRIGFGEAVLYSNQPIHFALFNPLTFLTSAELSTEEPQGGDDAHNSLIWLDFEAYPLRDVRMFGSLLIDDLKFSVIKDTSVAGNTNKLAWQGGVEWTSPFSLPALLLSIEYTRINPFVLSHWTDINSYTNWNLSLGPSLPPNSDEWMLGADYDVTSRLSASLRLRFQRSGENVTDSLGNVIFDAGSDLLHGKNALVHPNRFLQGTRVNRTIGSLRVEWQPVLQYFVALEAWGRSLRIPSRSSTFNDATVALSVRVEY